jgi:hypothetical protein
MGEAAGSERLHRKYRDWCSARLAEHFLQLSPEEIYALSQEASPLDESADPGLLPGAEQDPARGRSPGATPATGPAAHPSITAGSSYRRLIEHVTGTLAERIGLPTFEQWAAAYEEDPERFEGELWEADVPGADPDP